MKDPLSESVRWWRQAEADLKTAEALFEDDAFSACAFHAQQAAEKALKALLYLRGLRPFGHSLVALLARAAEEGYPESAESISDAASRLDKHYISARYPDAFQDQIPADYYTVELAEEALAWSRLLMQYSGANLSYLRNADDATQP